ncbi:proto-oncogene Mas-like [Carettochelys insculpta]|uniref:proto-oncogene Mas-like n=1 Tax=Carettochelys insculpta TaxID=44489 RepID=UPI003EB73A1C
MLGMGESLRISLSPLSRQVSVKEEEISASCRRRIMTEMTATSQLLTETSPYTLVSEPGCQTHFSEHIPDSITVLICLLGLVGNGVVLWLLGVIIKRNPFTVYIFNLAVADFTFLLCLLVYLSLSVTESLLCGSEFGHLIMVSHLLFLLPHNASLYLLTAVSLERCLSIFWPLWCRYHRPKHLSALLCALLWALSSLISGLMSYFCVSHEITHCRASAIAMYAVGFLLFAPVMVLTNLALFIKIRRSSQQRQPGKLYIVILLTVFFFLLFAVPFSIQRFGQYFNYFGISPDISYGLAAVNSSINPVIYFLVGSYRKRHFRGSVKVALQRIFEDQTNPRDNRESHRTDVLEMGN